MWKYNSKKRSKYYDEVIRLHQEGLGCSKISRIIPVGKTTISNWISNFALENPTSNAMQRKSSASPKGQSNQSVEPANVKDLQAEIKRLKKELAYESMRAAAFNELINVAEKQFNISIRKKAGAKQ